MRGLKFLVLAVAIIAGVGAVALVKREIDRARSAAEVGQIVAPAIPPIATEKAEVLVVTRSLRLGETLRPEDMRWQPWPPEAVAPSFVTSDQRPEALENYVGAVVRSPFVADEPLADAKILQIDHPGVLSSMIREGLRAFAIRVAPETGAGGFVLPGDHVDVILTRPVELDVTKTGGEEEQKSVSITETLVRTVRVLAIDTVIDPEGENALDMKRTATLEVTPQQAELLSLGEQIGRITLALRGVAEFVNEDGQMENEPMPELAVDPRMFDPRFLQAAMARSADVEQPVAETAATGKEAEGASRLQEPNEIVYLRGSSLRREVLR